MIERTSRKREDCNYEVTDFKEPTDCPYYQKDSSTSCKYYLWTGECNRIVDNTDIRGRK